MMGALDKAAEMADHFDEMWAFLVENEPDRTRRPGWVKMRRLADEFRQEHDREMARVPGDLEAHSSVRRGAHGSETLAGLDALPNSKADQYWVLLSIYRAGDAGRTVDEIHADWEQELPPHREHVPSPNQLASRRNDLETKYDPAWIEPAPPRSGQPVMTHSTFGRCLARDTRRGSPAIVWVCTSQGRARLEQEPVMAA